MKRMTDVIREAFSITAGNQNAIPPTSVVLEALPIRSELSSDFPIHPRMSRLHA